MTDTLTDAEQELLDPMLAAIDAAKRAGLALTEDDFVWDAEYGAWTVDGMDPVEWLDAMTMD